jgi:hypothetical protein
MPSPPPAHQRRHPRPSRNQRIARRAGRQNQAQNRDSSHLSADNSAFLELASLQFEALARQTASRQSASRHRSRSVSPPPRRRRSQSFSPSPRRFRSRSRSPQPPRRSYRTGNPAATIERRQPPPSRRPAAVSRPDTADTRNPFTVTGRDLSPHQEAGSTARPSPEAESIIGWAEYTGQRLNTPRETDSYRPLYDQQPQRGYRASRGSRGPRTFRGTRGAPRSLFERINPRQ